MWWFRLTQRAAEWLKIENFNLKILIYSIFRKNIVFFRKNIYLFILNIIMFRKNIIIFRKNIIFFRKKIKY
jgi:hypothetical protein